jgi:2-methylisocitrate lyase-like PEP mutase family enzyme
MNEFETFSQLHYSDIPLLIGNVWDVASAKIYEETGFEAIATSSAAIANSMGYDDGQNMPFSLLLEIVKKIKRNISIPLSVDMERGYANTIPGILLNVEKLYHAGIAGINIEDSNSDLRLRSPQSFQKLISCITNSLSRKSMQLFVNARTDAFLLKLPNAIDETVLRANAYEAAGANGLFVPFMTGISDIKKVVGSISIPVNVFFCKGLPGFKILGDAGVKRISMGIALYKAIKNDLQKRVETIQQAQSVNSLF